MRISSVGRGSSTEPFFLGMDSLLNWTWLGGIIREEGGRMKDEKGESSEMAMGYGDGMISQPST